MRYAANDEDRSAEARKRKKRTEKAAKKMARMEEQSVAEI